MLAPLAVIGPNYHYAYPKTANHEASIPVFGTKAAVGFSSARCSSAFRPQQRMVLASLKECSHFLEQRPLITSGAIALAAEILHTETWRSVDPAPGQWPAPTHHVGSCHAISDFPFIRARMGKVHIKPLHSGRFLEVRLPVAGLLTRLLILSALIC